VLTRWNERRGEPLMTTPAPGLLQLKCGIDVEIEGQADAMLAEYRRGITALSEMRDFLTYSQMRQRWSREVYSATGTLYDSFKPGMFNRAYNPLIGKRPHRPEHPDDH
jgi:hypothetical protein